MLRGLRLLLLGLLAPMGFLSASAAELAPPGFRPLPPGTHALVGARVFPKPDTLYSNATVVIRDGLIVAAGPEVTPPADARVWDCSGLTIYAGFIVRTSRSERTEPWPTATMNRLTERRLPPRGIASSGCPDSNASSCDRRCPPTARSHLRICRKYWHSLGFVAVVRWSCDIICFCHRQ